MILKIRSLVIVSLLVMLLPEVGSGILSKTNGDPLSNINMLNPLSPDSYENQNYVPYYPDKSKMDYKKPNLFIGGILQNSPNADLTDQKWKTFADNNGAIFVPTYYSVLSTELLAVNDAAKSTETDPHKTAENGLIRNELNGRTYGTIIGYSGGTTTVVTAMAEQGVKADTLILISPMMGGSLMTGETFDWKGEFEQKIQKILTRNPGIKIMVIQSTDDTLPLGDPLGDGSIAAGFQYRILENDPNPPSWLNKIEVNNVILGNVPNGHKEIFDKYAMQNIKDGAFTDPNTPQPSTKSIEASAPGLEEAIPVAANVFSLGEKKNNAVVIDSEYGDTVLSSIEKAKNWYQAGASLCQQGKYEEAIKVYKNAMGVQDNTIPLAWMCIGDALFQQGKYEEAIKWYRETFSSGFSSDQEIRSAWRKIGDALNKLGRTTESNAAFAKADEVQPVESRWQEEDNMVMRTGGTNPSPSSTPDTGWIEEKIRSEMADENSDLVKGLQDYVNGG